jgi:predicted dithiol-disulfide oxidoreductase (DUF899 family)
MNHQVVSQDEWIAARRRLLAKEKEFTRLRDELSRERRELPWERVDKPYVFETQNGRQTLADLFDGCHQLVVYHFMFAPDWENGCKSCSFWADNFNGIVAHLRQRDVSFVAVSRAPWQKLHAFAQRLGWNFKWVSSGGNDFNFDYQVSFTEQQMQGEVDYNYGKRRFPATDAPGVSVFLREGDSVFHTYSSFGRGIDMLNTAYHYLDLVPKGRDEEGLPSPMAWVKLHDQYST